MAVAVTVADPCETPVTVKDPLTLPDGMVTALGDIVTKPPGPDERFTTVPDAGAGALKVTVPVTL